MISSVNDLPYWARDLLRQARQAQANEGAFYRELCAKFNTARRPLTPCVQRKAVAQFVDNAYALAASILQTPAEHPAHLVDFAIGLLNEAMTHVKAETREAS
ncbi:hypothetical protein [Bradyrhizobium sp.]|uniref:hypothetical protein n=1 Tax=Bradyrhizobium sp. TaxID=376 RepID=UPI002BF6152B|nr:hypothetical protein [Bradyrhizobium sp.]HMM87986.1 hypothetical protein [Bradyrhizobium sp.]